MPDEKQELPPLTNEEERFCRLMAARRDYLEDDLAERCYRDAFFPGGELDDRVNVKRLAAELGARPQVKERIRALKEEIFSQGIMSTGECLFHLSYIGRKGDRDSSKVAAIKLILQVSGDIVPQSSTTEELSAEQRAITVLDAAKDLWRNTEISKEITNATKLANRETHQEAFESLPEPFAAVTVESADDDGDDSDDELEGLDLEDINFE